jgi:hypothetical protein
MIDWLWWGETMSQNCGHQWAYCSSPGWYVSMESHGDIMIPDAGNSWLVHQSSLAVTPAETCEANSRKWMKEWEFCLFSVWDTSRDLQHAVKSYDKGPPALLAIWRTKMCCRFVSPIEIHHLNQVWTHDLWVQW